jgi:signal peptidase II
MSDRPAILTGLRRYAIMAWAALGILVLDQASKLWIGQYSGLREGVYPPEGGMDVIPGFFSIVYNTNTGAAWGMFSGHGVILAVLGAVAIAAIILMHRQLELHRKTMQLVFGLMIGGIAGNIIDRVLIGRVTDFLDFHVASYRWPTFNIADSAMVVGVGLYIVIGLFHKDAPAVANPDKPPIK